MIGPVHHAAVLGLVLLVVALARVGAAPRFVVEPTDVTVRLHESAAFHCQVVTETNATVYVKWNKIDSQGSKTQLAFANSVMPKWTSRIRMHNGSLVIANVTRELAGRYECVLPLQHLSRIAELMVIADPEILLIETTPNAPLIEGANVSFTCAAFSAFPTPQFVWTASGRSDFVESISITASSSPDRYGWHNVTFYRTVAAKDHATTLHCVATNPLTDLSRTASLTLTVLFSPKMSSQGRTIRMMENSSLALECDATANPDNITYQWLVPDAMRGFCTASNSRSRCKERVLRVPRLERSASGSYVCEASNSISVNENRKALAVWNLTVLHPPKILLEDSYSFVEHSLITLPCFNLTEARQSVTSVDEVSWSFEKAPLAISTQSVISKTASRDATGRYECRLRVHMAPTEGDGLPETRLIQKSTQLVVQYLPGRPHIRLQPDHSSMTLKLGSSFQITCTLPYNEIGEPPAAIEWTSSHSDFGSVIGSGNKLEIIEAELKDEGVYRCTPVNAIGRGQSSNITVRVVGALFENRLPPRISKRARDTYRPDHETLALDCSLCTQPAMNITWLHNGIPIKQSERRFEIANEFVNDRSAACKHRIRSVLLFFGTERPARRALQLADLGTYSCLATLGNERIANSTTFLEVKHQPVFDVRERYFHAKPNQSVALECITHGHPLPEVTWHRVNQSQAVRGVEVDFAGQRTTRSRLIFDRVTEASYGTYICVASNEEGTENSTITLRKAGQPGVPTNLRVTEVTWESVRLEWDSDDDGGAEQQFFVIYSSYEHSGAELKLNASTSKRVTIAPLASSKRYWFRVKPLNSYGDGPISANVSARTHELVFPSLRKVQYIESTKTLMVNPTSPTVVTNVSFCLRIEFYSAQASEIGSWRPIAQCLAWRVQQEHVQIEIPSSMLTDKNAENLRVSACLAHRTEVCSRPVVFYVKSAGSEDANRWVLYVAAIVCVTIVLGISSLFFLSCYCRRRHARRKLRAAAASSKSKGSYVKADSSRNEMVLSTTENAIDEHIGIAQSTLRRHPQHCNTYVCVDNTDVHPAQLGIMPHSMTPLRHLADLPLSSADTSDTSVSLLPPREAMQLGYEHANGNYAHMSNHAISNGCHHQHHSMANGSAFCGCCDVQRLINTGLDRNLRADCEDASSTNNNLTIESASNTQLQLSCGIDPSWPAAYLNSRQPLYADSRGHSFNPQYLVSQSANGASPEPGLTALSGSGIKPISEQVFEVIV